MSTEIIHKADIGQLRFGSCCPLRGKYWPTIGVQRTPRHNIHGIAFADIDALREAVEVLTRELAEWEMRIKTAGSGI